MTIPIRILAALVVAFCAAGTDRFAHSQTDAGSLARASAEPAAATGSSLAAGATFLVDGQQKRFEHLPPGHNSYTRMGSTVTVMAAAGATAKLTINFPAIDLGSLQLPVELPLPRGARAPGNPLAALASVGFGYVDASGQEWAGPGRVRLEAFGADGMLEGRFSAVSIPHTGKRLSNIALDQGRFRVRLPRR